MKWRFWFYLAEDSCEDTFERFPNEHVLGGVAQHNITTLMKCKTACLKHDTCTAVDWEWVYISLVSYSYKWWMLDNVRAHMGSIATIFMTMPYLNAIWLQPKKILTRFSFTLSLSIMFSCFIVRRAGLLWSQQDFEWWWSVPLSSASLY